VDQVQEFPMTELDSAILPPPLSNHVATFSRWVDAELVLSGRADVVNDPIVHYTTREGLEGILSSGSIRLTDLGQARDDSEFLYGRGLAKALLTEAFAVAGTGARDHDEAISTRLFCEGTLSMLEKISPASGPFRFYSASFCERGDDAFLWREYAANGEGFALKLSPVVFSEPPTAAPLTVMDQAIRLRMIYDRSEATRVLEKVVEEGIRTVRAAGLSGSTDPHVGTTFLHSMSVHFVLYVLAMATRFKKQCLSPEHELRLLLVNEEEKLASLEQTLSSGKRFVQYQFVPSLRARGVLEEITVGPRAPSNSELHVRQLLLDCGYPTDPDGEPVTVVRRSAACK
jgi:hypothetical protein